MKLPTIPPDKEVWFCLAVAMISTLGYLLATVPPVFADPLLHHGIDGARSYPYGWLIWPIALLLFTVTFLLMYLARLNLQRLVVAEVTLGVAYIASMFVLWQRFPHPNVLFVGIVWVSITGTWLLIRYSLFSDNADTLVGVDKDACLQFIREQLEFSRLLLLGLRICQRESTGCISNLRKRVAL